MSIMVSVCLSIAKTDTKSSVDMNTDRLLNLLGAIIRKCQILLPFTAPKYDAKQKRDTLSRVCFLMCVKHQTSKFSDGAKLGNLLNNHNSKAGKLRSLRVIGLLELYGKLWGTCIRGGGGL